MTSPRGERRSASACSTRPSSSRIPTRPDIWRTAERTGPKSTSATSTTSWHRKAECTSEAPDAGPALFRFVLSSLHAHACPARSPHRCAPFGRARRPELHLPRARQGIRARTEHLPALAEGPAHRDLRHGAQQHLLAVHRHALRHLPGTAGQARSARRARRRGHTARGFAHRPLTPTRVRVTVAWEAVMSRIFALAFAGLLSLGAAAPVSAASFLEFNFGLTGPRYDALVPLCDDRGVLIQIHSKFTHKEAAYWNSNLEILGIDRIREVAFRPWQGAPQAIPRRFCNGVA